MSIIIHKFTHSSGKFDEHNASTNVDGVICAHEYEENYALTHGAMSPNTLVRKAFVKGKLFKIIKQSIIKVNSLKKIFFSVSQQMFMIALSLLVGIGLV